MTKKIYPVLLDRMKANLIDGIIIMAIIYNFAYIFSLFENVPDYARIIAFVFTFILYDPLLTSIFGGSIGHIMLGIRVKRETNESRNLLFPLAVIRFIVKIFLGWISMDTSTSNEKGKALHDYLVGSVVVYASLNDDKGGS